MVLQFRRERKKSEQKKLGVCSTCVHNRLGEQVSLECSQQRPGPAHGTCRPNPTSHPAAYSPLQRSPPVQDTAKTYETRTRPEEKKKKVPFLSIFFRTSFFNSRLAMEWNGPRRHQSAQASTARSTRTKTGRGNGVFWDLSAGPHQVRSGQGQGRRDTHPKPPWPDGGPPQACAPGRGQRLADALFDRFGSAAVTGRSPWVQPPRLGQSISDLARGLGWAGPRGFGGRPISAGLGRVEEAKSNSDVGQTTAEAR